MEKVEITVGKKEYSVYYHGDHVDEDGRRHIHVVEVYDAEKMIKVPITMAIVKEAEEETQIPIEDPRDLNDIYERMAREEGW